MAMAAPAVQTGMSTCNACFRDVRPHRPSSLPSAISGRKVVWHKRRLGGRAVDTDCSHFRGARMQVATGVETSASASTGQQQLYELAEYAEGELDHPRWAGNDPLAKFVSALISFKPLFDLMKPMARNVLIKTAEENGIPWKKMSADILASKEVYEELERLENKELVYPDYYLKEFHAYESGNLSWLAASEVEQATMSMARRAIPSAKSVEDAFETLRGGWFKAVHNHHVKHSGGSKVSAILDVGCATGNSTRYLADKFPDADVTGLDLSPYFVAVAQHLDKQMAVKNGSRKKPIHWMHAKGEDTGLPSASFDLVSLSYVAHECPPKAIRDLLKEGRRLLRPGGTIAVTDNSPKSKIIQDLPPVLFTLMKSTEPWADTYYIFNLEEAMRETGFLHVESRLTDPRHRTATGSAPC